jgi:beta-1,4-N-acetylglucosaminyltransferase
VLLLAQAPIQLFQYVILQNYSGKNIFIESFAKSSIPTLSGRIIYPIADLFIVQWGGTKKRYPKAVYGGSIY